MQSYPASGNLGGLMKWLQHIYKRIPVEGNYLDKLEGKTVERYKHISTYNTCMDEDVAS